MEAPAEKSTGNFTTQLKGYVQRYFPDIRMGTLKSDSMNSYSFHLSDWSDRNSEPAGGQRVTFDIRGNRATNIKPV